MDTGSSALHPRSRCAVLVRRVRSSEIRVDVVIAHVARDNAESRRVMEGAGFAEIETQHGRAVEDLAIVDTCVYACEIRQPKRMTSGGHST